MQCSPTKLWMDLFLWAQPGFIDAYEERYKNETMLQFHDCALISMPCESDITKMFSLDEALIFWFDLLFMYIFNNLINVTGVVANVLNVIIFIKTSIAADSTNSLLLGLAVSDLMIIVLNLLINSNNFICLLNPPIGLSAYAILWGYGNIIHRMLNLLCMDFVAVISTQKAVCIVFPFKASTIFSQRNTNIIIITLVCLCFLAMVPLFSSGVPRSFFHHYFKHRVILSFQAIHEHQSVMFSYYTLYLTSRSVLGVSVILVTGVVTALKLKQQAVHRASLRASTRKPSSADSKGTSTNMGVTEVKVVKMSLVICLISFIIYACAVVSNRIVQTRFLDFYTSTLFPITSISLYTLLTFNSCINFFVYLVMSDKFKTCCKELFFHCKLKK